VTSHGWRNGAILSPRPPYLQYCALVQFWKWAVDEDEIERSRMDQMKAPKVPDKPVPIVEAEDFRKLLKAAEGKGYNERRDTAVLLTLYDSGVRLRELVGMRLEDIDLRDRLAYVTGKGGHTRAVRFGARTAVALDRYLLCELQHDGKAPDADTMVALDIAACAAHAAGDLP
jgi:site-specific recombinase XerD